MLATRSSYFDLNSCYYLININQSLFFGPRVQISGAISEYWPRVAMTYLYISHRNNASYVDEKECIWFKADTMPRVDICYQKHSKKPSWLSNQAAFWFKFFNHTHFCKQNIILGGVVCSHKSQAEYHHHQTALSFVSKSILSYHIVRQTSSSPD